MLFRPEKRTGLRAQQHRRRRSASFYLAAPVATAFPVVPSHQRQYQQVQETGPVGARGRMTLSWRVRRALSVLTIAAPTQQGVVSFAAAGTLQVAANATKVASMGFSGTGTFSVAAISKRFASMSFSGAGTLGVSAHATKVASVSLSSTGSLLISGGLAGADVGSSKGSMRFTGAIQR